VAKRHKLSLVLDGAQAFGCSYDGQPIGSYGDATVFSFHATKIVNAFEGGAITTSNPQLAEKARLMSNFGFSDYDEVSSVGTNGKMNEASAAMGLSSLGCLSDFIAINRRNHEQYAHDLAGISGISLLCPREGSNYHYVVIEVHDECAIGRDELYQLLWSENVLARRYYYPGCHAMEPYRSLFPDVRHRLPHTERLAARVLCLPTGTSVSADDIQQICRLIGFIAEHGAEARARLRNR
jgi:dTDP-4-amino-4,6-dideoxygalactose transaminase